MDTNKMREQFEVAFPEHLLATGWGRSSTAMMLERDGAGEYKSARTQGAWWAWQASREAVVFDSGGGCDETFCPVSVEEFWINQIKGHGLKVNP